MKNKNPAPGLVIAALSMFGLCYIARFLLRAVSNGSVPGKLGAIHYAGSVQYVASVVGCIVGLLLFVILAVMGLRFSGLLQRGADRED